MTTASISVAANPISERVGRLIAFAVCVIAVNNVSILWLQANPGRTVIADIAFIAMWLAVAAWILYVERLAPRHGNEHRRRSLQRHGDGRHNGRPGQA